MSHKNITNILESLRGDTALSFKKNLKEQWDIFVMTLNKKNIDDFNKIIKGTGLSVNKLNRIKPANINITTERSHSKMKDICENLTSMLNINNNINKTAALSWTMLCCCNEGKRLRFNDFLKNEHNTQLIIELFIIADNNLNENVFHDILSKLGFELKTEKGLMHNLLSTSKIVSQVIKAAIKAFFTKNDDDKATLKNILTSNKITAAEIIQFLIKLDTLTLHLISGPIHMIEALTGFKLKIKKDNIPLNLKDEIKHAIEKIELAAQKLSKKAAKKLIMFTKSIKNILCQNAELCIGEV
jgi:hypothetical protein